MKEHIFCIHVKLLTSKAPTMQKRLPVSALIFSSATITSVFLSIFPAYAAEHGGKIVSMTPTVIVKAQGAEKDSPNLDSQINFADTVTTGQAGRLELLLSGQSRLLLGPSTSIRFGHAAYGKILYKEIDIKKGTFRFRASSKPTLTYSIKTPAATLYVTKDTDIAAETRPGQLRLTLLEGELSICANGMGRQSARKRCLVPQKAGETFIIPVKGRISTSKTAVQIPDTCTINGPHSLLCKPS